MKKSVAITLGLVPALAAATCDNTPPGPDPCAPATYSAQACQYAVDHQGYYHDGTFYRHSYGLPFIYYTNSYSRFLSGGGVATPIGTEHFSPSFRGGSGAVAGGTVRGGFGTSGAAHAGGAGA